MQDGRLPLVGIPCRGEVSGVYKGQPINAQNSTYVRAIVGAGGAPFLIPIEARGDVLRLLFERVDGILLAGGGDVAPIFFGEAPHPSLNDVQPERDELEFALIRWGLAEGKPLLGICRGIQTMNVAAGGTLYQDITAQCPGAGRHDFFHSDDYARDFMAHPVAVEPGCRLSLALGEERLSVNSLHHQAVKAVPPAFRSVAHSPDGIVEGVEAPGHPFAVGVQWHPEELTTSQAAARRLFAAFVDACRDGRG